MSLVKNCSIDYYKVSDGFVGFTIRALVGTSCRLLSFDMYFKSEHERYLSAWFEAQPIPMAELSLPDTERDKIRAILCNIIICEVKRLIELSRERQEAVSDIVERLHAPVRRGYRISV